MSSILLLCTANVCRSVMAEGMLAARLAPHADGTVSDSAVAVSSAGLLDGGYPPPPEVVSVMAARGIDVRRHRSKRVTAADLAAADLVLGLAREHVRHAAVLFPESWDRTFTLRELVRRGEQAGPRAPGEPLGAWLARAAHGRARRDLLGTDPADDVADPYGGPPAGYAATGGLLDGLTRDLAALGWPG